MSPVTRYSLSIDKPVGCSVAVETADGASLEAVVVALVAWLVVIVFDNAAAGGAAEVEGPIADISVPVAAFDWGTPAASAVA